MGQAPSSRHLRTVPYGVLTTPVLPSTRLDRAIRAPQAVLSRRSARSPTDLATIDEGWENGEPAETTTTKAPSARMRAVARVVPRPSARPVERLRGSFVPILKLEVEALAVTAPKGPSPIPRGAPSCPAIETVDILEIVERAPAVRRIAIAGASAASPAIARETTSLAGVPTLKELLAARAHAREREIAERAWSAGTTPAGARTREAPVLFPVVSAPRAVTRRDVEGERALFALGTFVGALAVGLSVLVAMLLK